MNSCKEAVDQIVDGKQEAYIFCGNQKNAQESLRVQTFNYRKKLPEVLQDIIGIAKLEEKGLFYIRVYRRDHSELYERDPVTGDLVPMKSASTSLNELKRIIMLMKQDGKSQEEIDEVVVSWEKEEESNV